MDTIVETTASGVRDFDFLMGSWNVAQRRLKQRWVGSGEWDEFAGTSAVRHVLEGGGNVDEISVPERGFIGLTLRLFNLATGEWSIYWANSRDGILGPPVVGRFDGDHGVFFGEEMDGDRLVKVRFIWTKSDPDHPRWEQAFSIDGGRSWETNWYMDFTRADSAS